MKTFRNSYQALQRIAAGKRDEAAWRYLIRQHNDLVWGVCWRCCGSKGLAEDACQETWLAVRDGAKRFHPKLDDVEVSVRAWLSRVASSVSLTLIRGEKRRKLREDRFALQHQRETAMHDDWHPEDESVKDLRSAMAELPDKHRLPIQLFYFAGLDHQAMAQELNTTPNNSRVRLNRAVKALRGQMASKGVTAAGVLGLLALTQPPGWAAAPAASSALTATCTNLIGAGTAASVTPALVGGGMTTMSKLGIGLAAATIAAGVIVTPLTLSGSEHKDIAHTTAASDHRFMGVIDELDVHNGVMVVVSASGERAAYRPQWIGGSPKHGGGLDKKCCKIYVACGQVMPYKATGFSTSINASRNSIL